MTVHPLEKLCDSRNYSVVSMHIPEFSLRYLFPDGLGNKFPLENIWNSLMNFGGHRLVV